jgi:uncharacterized protein YjbI with pentapeptide repeats
MNNRLLFMTLLLSLYSNGAYACPEFKDEYGNRWIIEKSITANMDGCDFSNVYVGNSLKNVSARGANFTNAEIYHISHSDLSGANFTNADINMEVSNSKLDDANFTNADIGSSIVSSTAVNAIFIGATLSRAIKDSDFTNANFKNARFTGESYNGIPYVASLENSNFTNANFQGASFTFRTLAPTFKNLILDKADFTNAFVWWRSHYDSSVGGDKVSLDRNNPVLEEIRQKGGIVYNEDLEPILRDPARLEPFKALIHPDRPGYNISFPRAIPGMNLSHADLRHAAILFNNCNWKTYSCDFRNVNFSYANLSSLSLFGDMDGADFTGAILSGASLDGSMRGTKFDHATLTGATIDSRSLAGASFNGAKTEDVTLAPLSRDVDQMVGITASELDPKFVAPAARNERLNKRLRTLEKETREALKGPFLGSLAFALSYWLWRRTQKALRSVSAPSRIMSFTMLYLLRGTILALALFHASTAYFRHVVIIYHTDGLLYVLFMIVALPLSALLCVVMLAIALTKKEYNRARVYGFGALLCLMGCVHAYGTASYIP